MAFSLQLNWQKLFACNRRRKLRQFIHDEVRGAGIMLMKTGLTGPKSSFTRLFLAGFERLRVRKRARELRTY